MAQARSENAGVTASPPPRRPRNSLQALVTARDRCIGAASLKALLSMARDGMRLAAHTSGEQYPLTEVRLERPTLRPPAALMLRYIRREFPASSIMKMNEVL